MAQLTHGIIVRRSCRELEQRLVIFEVFEGLVFLPISGLGVILRFYVFVKFAQLVIIDLRKLRLPQKVGFLFMLLTDVLIFWVANFLGLGALNRVLYGWFLQVLIQIRRRHPQNWRCLELIQEFVVFWIGLLPLPLVQILKKITHRVQIWQIATKSRRIHDAAKFVGIGLPRWRIITHEAAFGRPAPLESITKSFDWMLAGALWFPFRHLQLAVHDLMFLQI